MNKIVGFLCTAGVAATMLGSSVLWSQDNTEQLESETQQAPAPEAPKPKPMQEELQENQPSTETKQQPAGDFKPSEEISEDFPVPLPSDI
ncbi:MAG: hypothetical protein P8Q91_01670 [Porticoccaceae bacterium]|jgi:hypothetical protein|nr:hypothetical protein [Porticoccaceae bacterium]